MLMKLANNEVNIQQVAVQLEGGVIDKENYIAITFLENELKDYTLVIGDYKFATPDEPVMKFDAFFSGLPDDKSNELLAEHYHLIQELVLELLETAIKNLEEQHANQLKA